MSWTPVSERVGREPRPDQVAASDDLAAVDLTGIGATDSSPNRSRNFYDEGGLISTSVRAPSTTIASSSVSAQCATPSAR